MKNDGARKWARKTALAALAAAIMVAVSGVGLLLLALKWGEAFA